MSINHTNAGSTWVPSKRCALGPGILSCTDKDGTAVLNVERDRMYSVIGLGSVIVSKLARNESGLTFESLVDKVTPEVKAAPRGQTEREVARLLDALKEQGIVQPDATRRLNLRRYRWPSGFMFVAHGVVCFLLKLGFYNLTAFLGLFVVNVVLKIVSFGALYRLVKSWPKAGTHGEVEVEEEIQRVGIAVDRATTWYPKQAQCLQRSAITVCLLRSCGVAAQMVIGVTKVPFRSHAWAEASGDVVNDTPKVSKRYRVMDRC